MIKIIDDPINRVTTYSISEYNAPWLTLSACCQAKTHYGLGAHICDKCKKDCDVVGYSDILALTQKQQKDEIAEYSKRKDVEKMAVKLVSMEERKLPRSKVGKFTGLDDIKQALNSLNSLPAGKAVEITLDKELMDSLRKDGTKDPARSIVNMLKRKFMIGGLSFKTYASDEKTITIIRVNPKPTKDGKK